MAWETEMTLTVRILINDLEDSPTYSDSRIQQLITVAGTYVQQEANLTKTYNIVVADTTITPDPTTPTKDDIFVALTCLKSACLLDQSTLRTKAVNEGIRTSLGSASISVQGNLSGYKTIIEMGPCSAYRQLLDNWNIGNATAVQAILSPFVGNAFDPRNFSRGYYGLGPQGTDIYS